MKSFSRGHIKYLQWLVNLFEDNAHVTRIRLNDDVKKMRTTNRGFVSFIGEPHARIFVPIDGKQVVTSHNKQVHDEGIGMKMSNCVQG